MLSRTSKPPWVPRFETKYVMGIVRPDLILLPWKFQRKGSGFFLEVPGPTLARGSNRCPAGQRDAHEKRCLGLVRSTLAGLPSIRNREKASGAISVRGPKNHE